MMRILSRTDSYKEKMLICSAQSLALFRPRIDTWFAVNR
ncbi:hypothetical protein P10159_3660 [Citrobacter portucalensis]|nr:hypothetical protein P10159_3660 [Citrobacter portucalensis]